MKKKKLIIKITREGIFGECDGHVAVIEYQKQGAPHCHMLIWNKNVEASPANIDSVICSELPPQGDPLHRTVIKLMMHGSYGQYNGQLGCVSNSKDGRCMR